MQESVKNMKKLFSVLFFFCLIQSVCYSAPNYDPNNVTTEWDPTYNIQLRNKLEDEFDKKYCKPPVEYTDKYGTFYSKTTCNFPKNGYYKEVLEPYILQSKNMAELPQKRYKTESK